MQNTNMQNTNVHLYFLFLTYEFYNFHIIS